MRSTAGVTKCSSTTPERQIRGKTRKLESISGRQKERARRGGGGGGGGRLFMIQSSSVRMHLWRCKITLPLWHILQNSSEAFSESNGSKLILKENQGTVLLSSKTDMPLFRCQSKTRTCKTLFAALSPFSSRGFRCVFCHTNTHIFI